MSETKIPMKSFDPLFQDIKKWFKDDNIEGKSVQIIITPLEKGSKLDLKLVESE